MPSKIGTNCSRNEDCNNKNCVSGKCTRKTAKKTQKKKVGEACNTNKDCKNNNCVSKKCSRKTSKKTQKSPSPVRKVSPPKSPSPSSSSRANNAPAKSLSVTYKPDYSDTEKLRKAGFGDGDVVIVDKELRKRRIEAGEIRADETDEDDNSNGYYIVSGKRYIYVGINNYDTFDQFNFPEESTKYTTNFFKKYKDILKRSERNGGVYELRHDDKFIKKYFNNTTSKNIYRVNIDSEYDESDGNIQISESSRPGRDTLRRQDIEGDLRTILRSDTFPQAKSELMWQKTR